MFRRLVIAAFLVYAALLFRYNTFAAGGSDASGYLNAAHLISEGRLKVRVKPLDTLGLDDSWRQVFVPLGFAWAPQPKTIAPSYPLGYPLHMVPFGVAGGWKHAPFYVTPLLALLTLIVTYQLAREISLSQELSVAASALLAVAPSMFNQAVQPMSDVIAMFWCTLTVLCAIRGERSARWAAACGAVFAMSVWVRPSNLLLMLAIGFAMRWRIPRLAIAVAAALPFAIALMAVNRYMYGSGLVTGYGGVGGMLSWSLPCGLHHLKWLAITMTPFVFPGGLLLGFDRRVAIAHRLALLSWFISFLVFYSIYPICDAWWYLRFLVPAFPAILIGAVAVMRDFVAWPRARYAMIAIVFITGIIVCRHYRLGSVHTGEATYPNAIHWAKKQLPPNAIVATMQFSGAYYFYAGELPARYDQLDANRFAEIRAYTGVAGLKWYALVFDWEEKDLFAKMPGRWTKLNQMRNVGLWRLDS